MEEDEAEIFYLDNDEEPDNEEEPPEFTDLYLENTWDDIEPLPLNYLINYTSTIEDPELLYPNEEDDLELDSEVQKGAQTIQELEIIWKTLHDRSIPYSP